MRHGKSKYITIPDVEIFKRKMHPKKQQCNTRSRKKQRITFIKSDVENFKHQAKKKQHISVNKSDVEDFKLKFHPARSVRAENENNCLKYAAKLGTSISASSCKVDTLARKSRKLEKRFLCDICSAMFSTSTNMKEHRKIHADFKEHKCPHCAYACHRERNLRTHMLTHETKKPIQCPKCEYTCIQNFQLRAHLLLHESDTPFQCHLCQATYKKEAGLKVHILTHSNVHKFKCPDCKYVGNRYADFRRHVLIHSKAKPIKCPYCSYSCIRQSRLKAHILVHRRKNTSGEQDSFLSNLEQNALHCDFCDYVCTVQSRLKKHKKSHAGVNPYTCNLCSFSCSKSSSLREHKQHHHKTETEPVASVSNQAHEEDQASLTDHNDMLRDTAAAVLSQSDNCHQIFQSSSEHPTVIFSQPETFVAAAAQNDEDIVVCSNVQQWDGEVTEWQEHFTVQDLTAFTFDPMTLQSTQNCLVTVVREDNSHTTETLHNFQVPPQIEAIKQEPKQSVELEQQTLVLLQQEEPQRSHHSTAKMYHCDRCNFSCDYKSTYKKHVRKHATVKNYKCAHCEYMCDELSRMKKHLIVHTDQKAFQCEICDYCCKSRSTLHHHMKTHASADSSTYQCTQCEYACKSAAGLKSHLARHLGENLYRCDLCQMACRSAYLLKKHKFSHGQKPVQCQYCSYSCVQQQQMNIHLLQHTFEFPFCCPMCNAKYKKEDSLKVHVLSKHDNKHRFSCSLCNYAGNRAADFREHMLTHSDQKPHQCPHCTYSCIRPTQLRKHLLTHEKDSNSQAKSQIIKKKMYRCAFCDFTCTRMPQLKAHLSKVHLDLPENIIFSVDLSPS